ncbi:MAG TPA: DUF72 domain-containing protein [Candidatus Dormibacteraeota bacterium]
MLYAGASGFSYPGWRGVFYPEKLAGSRMLGYYSERLNGVELNGTFYRTPKPAALAKWATETPPGFRFCFKAHRGLTYSGAAFDKAGLARQLGPQLAALAERLGPVLLQWPPTRGRDPELLDAVLEALGLAAAVEFRDPSWFDDAVYTVLEQRGAALVVTDEDKWPRAPEVRTAPFAYYRLRRDYSDEELAPWSERLANEAQERDVYAYFKHEPQAPARALALLARAATASSGRRSR